MSIVLAHLTRKACLHGRSLRIWMTSGINLQHQRPFGVASSKSISDPEKEWEAAFVAATADVSGELSHADSASAMRKLLRTNLLRNTDLRDRPERFFKAHRLLARHAVAHGPGFWIRFTVHFNLCFGTVLAVGNPVQIA
jgi:hypothetical protein